MKPITRKEAVKELDQYNEQLAHWAVDLENEVDERMLRLQKILINMDKFQKALKRGTDDRQ